MAFGVYVANLESRGMVTTNYVEDHQTLIYTKYISCGPHGYRKDLSFSHYMRVIDPRGVASFHKKDLCKAGFSQT